MRSTLECVGEWISRQRWYAGKGHVPRLRELSRQQLPSDDPRVRVSILLVMDDEGDRPTLYQVPIVERPELPPAARPHLIGRAYDSTDLSSGATSSSSDGAGAYLIDGPHDPAFPVALLRLMAPALLETATVTGTRVLSAEQSNTSIIFDTDGEPTIICKVFRTLHHGDNPDVTLQSALSAAGSTAVPRFIGQLRSEWDDVGQPNGRAAGHLAFAQEFLAHAEDGWSVALRCAAAGDDFSEQARILGRETAGVHATLAKVLPTSQPTPAHLAAIAESWDARLATATREIPALLEHRDRIAAVYAEALAAKWPQLQRIHGDFHLGQALLMQGRGWVFVDFEGEPLRPMHERDRPDVTLRDVAGMLRSFDYAAGSTPGWPTEWADACRAAFLDGYLEISGYDEDSCRPLIAAFVLDKAVYEAIYEVRNRPDWLGIPLRGIEQLVASREVGLPRG